MVDAFLREACDRIETHDQYEVIRICHIRIKLHWGEKKETCHRNAFRAAGSTCALIEYRVIGCIFNGYHVYTLQENRAIYRVANSNRLEEDSGRNTLYTKSRESTSVSSKVTYRSFSGLQEQNS